MTSLALAFVVFICSFSAAIVGMHLHRVLPDNHLDADSRDVIKLVMGLIATISALVLGLLIASANSAYDSQSGELQALSADVVLLDRLLVAYGPGAEHARDQLHEAIVAAHERIWARGQRAANLDAASKVVEQLQMLVPTTDAQRLTQSSAMQLSETILRTRLLMFEQLRASISWPFLCVLIFWISVLFLGFGLFARRHATMVVTLLIGSLSVAGAIFLIKELSDPYHGFMQISDAPLREAMAEFKH